jgi:hypothetical protein
MRVMWRAWRGAIAACVPTGTLVEVTEGSGVEGDCNAGQCAVSHVIDGRRWLHIRLPDGTEGWAAVGYFEHADPPP